LSAGSANFSKNHKIWGLMMKIKPVAGSVEKKPAVIFRQTKKMDK